MNKDGTKITRGSAMRRSVDGFMVTAAPRRQQAYSLPQLRPTSLETSAEEPAAVEPQVAAQPEPEVPAATFVEPEQTAELKQFPLPRYTAPERPVHPLRKRISKTMLALRCASAVLAVFLATGGFLMWRGYSNLHKVFHGTTTVAALSSKEVAPQLLKGEGDGRVNILLLGVGGPGHDGPDLTDTMVVLSVDPVNNTATMLSIPRDLWVKMPVNYFGSNQKINAAYESGKYSYLGHLDASNTNGQAVQAGFKAADQVVKETLDLNINYHMLVNFQAFRQAIDTVGGVTINVPTPLIDPTMQWENHNNPVLAPAGVQQMDGVKALLYARSRETTSDFARTQRQRQILIALKDKVLTAGTLSNPAKISSLLNAFGNNVYSDMSTSGAVRLVSIMQKVGDNKITSFGLADQPHQLVTTDHVGTTSVVRPVAGFDNYTDIQNYVHSQLPDGYLLKEHAAVAIQSATTAGAADLSATLTSYGYSVTSATVLPPQAVYGTTLVDLSDGTDPYTKHYLQDRLGVSAVTKLPAGFSVANPAAKFVIISAR